MMNRGLWCGALLAAVAMAGLTRQSAAQSHPPVEAFGSLPALASPCLAPDGKHFAVIQTTGGQPIVAIYEVGASAKPAIVPPSNQWVVRAIRWVKNDRLILFVSAIKTFGHATGAGPLTFFRAISVNAQGEADAALLMKNLSANLNGFVGDIVDVAVDDPQHVYIPLWTPQLGFQIRNDLYRVDVATGAGERVQKGGSGTYQWIMDGRGQPVARLGARQAFHEDLEWYKDGDWIDAGDKLMQPGLGTAGVAEDGHTLVRFSAGVGDMRALTGVTQSGKETLIASKPYDIAAIVQDEWSGRIVGARYDDDRSQTFYFDDARQTLQNGLDAAFPGKTVQVQSIDLAGDRVIVAVDAPRAPITYYYLDRTTHAATAIGSAYPALAEADLGEVKPYPYKARDGLTIAAYLTLPPGKTARNLPAVILPHGGPDARDAIRFDWMAQFLANRGYAVLQPNFRGSTGYGTKFHDAGLKQWGLKMQDDISDGVKRLIADGIVDPKRVCIAGASYGGYAALAGATLSPDLYACTIAIAGISDLPRFLAWDLSRSSSKSASYLSWKMRIGVPDDDSEQLRATSPARQAGKARAPVLLVHGEGDSTVPIRQSEIMEEALQSAGKPVTLIRLAGDDHYFTQSASRVALLRAMESFLAANIGH